MDRPKRNVILITVNFLRIYRVIILNIHFFFLKKFFLPNLKPLHNLFVMNHFYSEVKYVSENVDVF